MSDADSRKTCKGSNDPTFRIVDDFDGEHPETLAVDSATASPRQDESAEIRLDLKTSAQYLRSTIPYELKVEFNACRVPVDPSEETICFKPDRCSIDHCADPGLDPDWVNGDRDSTLKYVIGAGDSWDTDVPKPISINLFIPTMEEVCPFHVISHYEITPTYTLTRLNPITGEPAEHDEFFRPAESDTTAESDAVEYKPLVVTGQPLGGSNPPYVCT